MKKTIYTLSICALLAAAAVYADGGRPEQDTTPMTDAESAAIARWTAVLDENKDLPTSSVWTTGAGRMAFMKLMKQFMPGFGRRPHGRRPHGDRPPEGMPPMPGAFEDVDA
jgi:hypothetical protein